MFFRVLVGVSNGNRNLRIDFVAQQVEHTNTLPLEIDHIDGNSENNSEENLRLICPNCHSLTANYRGANRGNGRNITWIIKTEN